MKRRETTYSPEITDEIMQFANQLFIRVDWDEEVMVWVATSDDVSGLATCFIL